MAAPNEHKFQEKIVGLQQAYLKRLKTHMKEVRRSKELLLKDILPRKDIQLLYRLTNNFTGSGATFGFPDISTTSGNLNRLLKRIVDEGVEFSDVASADKADLLNQLEAFEAACRAAVSQNLQDMSMGLTDGYVSAADQNVKTVGLITKKQESVSERVKSFDKAGYRLIHVDGFEALAQSRAPDVLLIDQDDLSYRDTLHLQNLLQQRQAIAFRAPIIFIDAKDDFQSRLEAVQLGAQAYFTAADTDNLILDKISKVTSQERKRDDQHVLIIARDEMAAEFYGYALQHAGMKINVLTSSRDPLKLIRSEKINTILIDSETPFGDVTPVITALRQDTALSTMPLVVLIGKENDAQQQALEHNAVPLAKPFTPEKLVATLAKAFSSDVQEKIKDA